MYSLSLSLYAERSSNTFASETGALWLPFQTAAGTVTTLYKGECERDGLWMSRFDSSQLKCQGWTDHQPLNITKKGYTKFLQVLLHPEGDKADFIKFIYSWSGSLAEAM